MNSNRQLIELVNIGDKLSRRLQEVGIFNEEGLRNAGAIEAHRRIRHEHPNESLPLCYYLYSFEGALTDRHWNDIGEQRKRQLRQKISK